MEGGIQAKIIGPAEFDIEKENDIYVINMLAGEFVELKSVEPEEEKVLTQKPFVTNEPNPIAEKAAPSPVQVVVKTAEFEVSSDSSDGTIDMTITEQDGQQIVENSGADVIITKLIQDQKVVTPLKTKQKASINGDVHIAAITPDVDITEQQAEQIVETLKNNDLTISYKTEPSQSETEPTLLEENQEEIVPVVAAEPAKEEPIAQPKQAELPPLAQEEPQEEKKKDLPEEPLVEGKRVIG